MFHQYLDAEMLRTWCVHMVSMMCFMLFLGSSVYRCCLFVLFECCTFTSFVCPPYLCENHLVDIYDIEFIPFYSYDYLLLNLVFYLDYILVHVTLSCEVSSCLVLVFVTPKVSLVDFVSNV